MTIRVLCVCGQAIGLADSDRGSYVQCPDCRALLRMPTLDEDRALMRWHCSCRLRFKASPTAAGRRVRCPRCDAEVTVPAPDEIESL